MLPHMMSFDGFLVCLTIMDIVDSFTTVIHGRPDCCPHTGYWVYVWALIYKWLQPI